MMWKHSHSLGLGVGRKIEFVVLSRRAGHHKGQQPSQVRVSAPSFLLLHYHLFLPAS